MFIGHYALGFATKKAAPAVSLGMLFLAVQWLDLLWPTLLLLGLEEVVIAPGYTAFTPLHFTHYPISHSLLTSLGWSLLLALLYFAFTRNKKGTAIVALAVISHWFLDWLVHVPDLPLTPAENSFAGLGLWNYPSATLLLEGSLYLIGFGMYWRNTKATDRTGRFGLWALAALLVVFYLGNVYGPPPPSVTAIAWAGQGMWLLVLFGWWVDKHRIEKVTE